MRKHCLAYLCIIIFLCGCNAGSPNQKTGDIDATSKDNVTTLITEVAPTISFETTRYDFGTLKIKKNPKITVKFQFTNIGAEPLIIKKIDVSCSCLSVNYPKTPIESGGLGIVTITINTDKQKGKFNKSVFVKTNSLDEVALLRITGNLK